VVSLVALPEDKTADGALLSHVREALHNASTLVPSGSAQGATRNRFLDFCKKHNLDGWVSSGMRKQGVLRARLMWPANPPGGVRHALWGGEFAHVTDQDREDRALELALAAAQSAHRHLVERGFEPPPREARSWLHVGADEFERFDMFDANHREAGWSVLRQLRDAEVQLLALDEEGSGHCSCGSCAGECVRCATTFVQVCIWRRATKPLVMIDFWPEAEEWATHVAQVATTQPVATWGCDPLAARIFGQRVVNLQSEAGARMRADLRLPGSEPLGLKAAYAWVAHQRGETVYAHPKPKGVHARPGCWQRRHKERLLSEDHKRYAAADAYATGALFHEYLRDKGTRRGGRGERAERDWS
jgi:hypothetical protein